MTLLNSRILRLAAAASAVVAVGAVALYATHRDGPVSLHCTATNGTPMPPLCGPIDLSAATYRADATMTDCGNMSWMISSSAPGRPGATDQVLVVADERTQAPAHPHMTADHRDVVVTQQHPFTLFADVPLALPYDNSHCSIDLTITRG